MATIILATEIVDHPEISALLRHATVATAGKGEGFGRNRAKVVLVGGRRAALGGTADAAVLIPVDRVANRTAGGGARVCQSDVARAPRKTRKRHVRLVQIVPVLVSSKEGVGDTGRCLESAAERGGADSHVERCQKIGTRGVPIHEAEVSDISPTGE